MCVRNAKRPPPRRRAAADTAGQRDPALRRSAAPAALTERHSCELCFVGRKPKVKTLEETAPTSHSSFSVP